MKQRHSIVIVVFSALLGIGLLYPEVIFGLNEVMFSVEGDGLKNYFNFMYHIRHDSSYLTFEGMHYPYGETLLMVDLHPALSTVLKFVSTHIIDISAYSVGIMNGFMMFSIVLTATFLYLVFDAMRVSRVSAILGALAISFFSSQMLLWEYGHYALTYSCFFPISWYLIIRSRRSEKFLAYSLILLINSLFWFYTHNYLGLIVVGFQAGILFLLFLQEKDSRKRILLEFAAQVVLPLIIVYTVMQITDQREGRLEMPFLAEHKASIQTIFLPNYSFTKPFYQLFFDFTAQEKLSWSKVGTYIGLPVNLALIAFLIVSLVKIVRGRLRQIAHPFSRLEWTMIGSSFFLLLFSMAIPLSYFPDAFLPNMLKQFIGLGRFGWAFFYVITVFSIVYIYRVLPKKPALYLILFGSVLLLAESAGYHLRLKKVISQNPNVLKDFERSETMKALSGAIDFDQYQAIVPLPFYHKYITPTDLKGSSKSESLSMSLSYATGLPLMSAVLSRPSVLESKRILQLFSPWYYEKSLHHDLSDSPLLIIYTKEDLTEIERKFHEKGQVIFENEDIVASRIDIAQIFEGNPQESTEFLQSIDQYTSKENSGLYTLGAFPFVYESFDSLGSSFTKRGEGALMLDRHNLGSIYQNSEPGLDPNLEYVFSFWYYNYIYDQSFTGIAAHLKDSAGAVYSTIYLNDPIKTSLYDGNWAYNEFKFKVNNSNDQIELTMSAVDLYADSLYIDEILIFPAGKDVYKPIYGEDGRIDAVIKNNERIPIPSY